jgi:hypothetical protein
VLGAARLLGQATFDEDAGAEAVDPVSFDPDGGLEVVDEEPDESDDEPDESDEDFELEDESVFDVPGESEDSVEVLGLRSSPAWPPVPLP